MMSGMLGHFVLIVDGVNFLVRVIHKYVLRPRLGALDCAFPRSLVRCLRAALGVGDVACPAAVARHGQRPGEQGGGYCRRKTDLHDLSSYNTTVASTFTARRPSVATRLAP